MTAAEKVVPRGKLHPLEHDFRGLAGRSKIKLVGVEGYANEKDLPDLHSDLRAHLKGSGIVATVGSKTISKEAAGKPFGHLLPEDFRKQAKALGHHLTPVLSEGLDEKVFPIADATLNASRLLHLSRGRKMVTAVVPFEAAKQIRKRISRPGRVLEFMDRNQGFMVNLLSGSMKKEKAENVLKNVRKEFEDLKNEQDALKKRPNFIVQLFYGAVGLASSIFQKHRSEDEVEKQVLPDKTKVIPPLGEVEEHELFEKD